MLNCLLLAVAWIWADGTGLARVFRNDFSLEAPTRIEMDVSADMRYVLKLDGKIVGRGPDRDVVEDWTYRPYAFDLPAGAHRLEAVVYHGGSKPLAQISHLPGFFVNDRMGGKNLSTGAGGWKAADVSGFGYGGETGGAFGVGLPNVVHGSSPEFRDYPATAFGPVRVVQEVHPANNFFHVWPGWRLTAAKLPPQMEHPFPVPNTPFPLRIEARATREILLPLGDYCTAYPFLRTAGGRGATIRVAWSESREKLGKGGFFEDTFCPDGATNVFTTSWFRSGTLVRLAVTTAGEPLEIISLDLTESRYPLQVVGSFDCDDPTVAPVLGICRRGLEMCAHEGVYDCPFYEQLTYLGDTRVQFLAQNALTADDRLQKRCLELFSRSRGTDGMMPMNAPCDGPQSPSGTYTLIYPVMLGDYLDWHADRAWLAQQMPGMVQTMEGLRRFENADGLIENLPGWCFMDWADWPKGAKSPGEGPEAGKLSALENLFYVMALDSAARVARACGEPELAAVFRARKARTAAAVRATFWDESRGGFADGPDKRNFSEHAQVLAVLADILPEADRARAVKLLLEAPDLVRTSVYFSHYLFDALGKVGRTDVILKRLDLWRGYVKKGYYTPLESPEPSRSDCHGWGAHPAMNLPRHLAGIRPEGDFFERVRIAPNPASLKHIRCLMPHPKGVIEAEMDFASGVAGTVTLPSGLVGTFEWKGHEIPLKEGLVELRIE